MRNKSIFRISKYPIAFLLVCGFLAWSSSGQAQIAADADFNGDGAIGFADFLMFSEAFGTDEMRYDLDGSGSVDFSDFIFFLAWYGQDVSTEIEIQTPSGTVHEAVLVPAGSFVMGADEGNSDERPAHSVYLGAYYIDQFEVTNSQYAGFLNATGKQVDEAGNALVNLGARDIQIREVNGAFELKDAAFADHPIVEVSWHGARAYCAWAGGRLPREAEYEKAARGTDGRPYPWGAQAPDETLLNFNHSVGQTTGVRSYPQGASPYGARNLEGNVWEWVYDWYDSGYYAQSPQRDPEGPANGQLRVIRGSPWVMVPPSAARSADRFNHIPAYTDHFLGFRCVHRP